MKADTEMMPRIPRVRSDPNEHTKAEDFSIILKFFCFVI